jgi:hypothetical protein
MAKHVLALVSYADFTELPRLTPDLIRAFIDSQLQRLHAMGYEVESCFSIKVERQNPWRCILCSPGISIVS